MFARHDRRLVRNHTHTSTTAGRRRTQLGCEQLECRDLFALYIWAGPQIAGGDSNWSTAGNWLVGNGRAMQPPGAADTLAFTNLSVADSTMDIANFSVARIEVSSTHTGEITLASSLTVGGGVFDALTTNPAKATIRGPGDFTIFAGSTFTWRSGTFGGPGKTIVSNGATLNIESSNTDTQDARLAGRELEVSAGGTVDFSSGRIFCQNEPGGGGGGAKISNYGTFKITGTASTIIPSTATTFTNYAPVGRVEVSLAAATSAFQMQPAFHNLSRAAGIGVSVTVGKLLVIGGGTSTGTWNVADGQVISFQKNFTSGQTFWYTWDAGSEFFGPNAANELGVVKILQGAVTIPNGVTVPMQASLLFQGGVLSTGGGEGEAVLELKQRFDWQDGRTQGPGGKMIVKPGVFAGIYGNTDLLFSRPTLTGWDIDNQGEIRIGKQAGFAEKYTRVDFSMGGATIRNAAGRKIRVFDTSNILHDGGPPPALARGRIDMGSGWFIKEVNSGTSDFQVNIFGDAQRQITYNGSRYNILGNNGGIMTGPVEGRGGPDGRMSFRGPMDFDSMPLLLGAISVLDGDGLVTTATFQNDGRIVPGDVGTVGRIEFAGNYNQPGALSIDLADGGVSDELAVTGAANLASLGGTLDLSAIWATPPAPGTNYVIVRNATDNPTVGGFFGYPHGLEFSLGGVRLRISYYTTADRSDPNDVVLTVVPPPPAVISGRVFNDGWIYWGVSWDRDGVQNTPYMGGRWVTVQLIDASGVVVATTTSAGEHGYYAFNNVAPGSYRVQFALPQLSGMPFYFTLQNAGDDSLDSDVDADGLTALFTVGAGEEARQDAGVYWVLDRPPD